MRNCKRLFPSIFAALTIIAFTANVAPATVHTGSQTLVANTTVGTGDYFDFSLEMVTADTTAPDTVYHADIAASPNEGLAFGSQYTQIAGDRIMRYSPSGSIDTVAAVPIWTGTTPWVADSWEGAGTNGMPIAVGELWVVYTHEGHYALMQITVAAPDAFTFDYKYQDDGTTSMTGGTTSALTVISTTPVQDAVGVDQDALVHIVFSQELDEGAFDPAKVAVHLENHGWVTEYFQVAVVGNEIQIDPPKDANLSAQTLTVAIGKGLAAMSGDTLVDPFSLSYDIAAGDLRVSGSIPSRDKDFVDPATSVSIRFNQPLDPDPTALAGQISIVGSMSGDQTVNMSVVVDADSVVFSFLPDHSFTSGELVVVTVDSTVQTPDGKSLGNLEVFSFVVGVSWGGFPLEVVAATPADAAIVAETPPHVMIYFNQMISTEFPSGGWSITSSSVNGMLEVEILITSEGSYAVILPEGYEMAPGEMITVGVSAELTSSHGATLGGDGYTYSFTRAGEEPPPTSLQVIGTWPPPGAVIGVSPSKIKVRFNKALDEAASTENWVVVLSMQGGPISPLNLVVGGDSLVILFPPEFDMAPGDQLNVGLSPDVTAADGTTLTEGYGFTFSREGDPGPGEIVTGNARVSEIPSGPSFGGPHEYFDFSTGVVTADSMLPDTFVADFAPDFALTKNEGTNFGTEGTQIPGNRYLRYSTAGVIDTVANVPVWIDAAPWVSNSWESDGTSGMPISVGEIWVVYTREGHYALMGITSKSDTSAAFTFDYKYQPDGSTNFGPTLPPQLFVMMTDPPANAALEYTPSKIKIWFAEPLDASGGTAGWVALTPSIGSPIVPEQVLVAGDSIIVTLPPGFELPPGETMSVGLSDGITAISGSRLNDGYVFTFSREGDPGPGGIISNTATVGLVGGTPWMGEYFDFSTQTATTDTMTPDFLADFTFTSNEGINFGTEHTVIPGNRYLRYSTAGTIDTVANVPVWTDAAPWVSNSWDTHGTDYMAIAIGEIWVVYTREGHYAIMGITAKDGAASSFTFDYKYQPDGTTNFVGGTAPEFAVSGTTPANGESDVPLQPRIQIYFNNGTVDPEMFDNGQVAITGNVSGTVYDWSWGIMPGEPSLLEIILLPGFSFQPYEVVTVTINNSVTSSDGQTLGVYYIFQFNIGSGMAPATVLMPDLVGLTILDANQALEAVGLHAQQVSVSETPDMEQWNRVLYQGISPGTPIDTTTPEQMWIHFNVGREPGVVTTTFLTPNNRAMLNNGDTVVVLTDKPLSYWPSGPDGQMGTQFNIAAWQVGTDMTVGNFSLVGIGPNLRDFKFVANDIPSGMAMVLDISSYEIRIAATQIAVYSDRGTLPTASITGLLTPPPAMSGWNANSGESYVMLYPREGGGPVSPGTGFCSVVSAEGALRYTMPAVMPGEYYLNARVRLARPDNPNYSGFAFGMFDYNGDGESDFINLTMPMMVNIPLKTNPIGLMQGITYFTPDVSPTLLFAIGGPSTSPDIRVVDLGPVAMTKVAKPGEEPQMEHMYDIVAGQSGVLIAYLGTRWDVSVTNIEIQGITVPDLTEPGKWQTSCIAAKRASAGYGDLWEQDMFVVRTSTGKFALIQFRYGSHFAKLARTPKAAKAAKITKKADGGPDGMRGWGGIDVGWAYQPDGTTYFGRPISAEIEMPQIVGMSVADAQAMLDRLGSFYLETDYVPAPTPSLYGLIKSQDPSASTLIWNEHQNVRIEVWAQPATAIHILSATPANGATSVGTSLGGDSVAVSIEIVLSGPIEMREDWNDDGGGEGETTMPRISRTTTIPAAKLAKTTGEPTYIPNVEVNLAPGNMLYSSQKLRWSTTRDTIWLDVVARQNTTYDYLVGTMDGDGVGAEIPWNEMQLLTFTTGSAFDGATISGTVEGPRSGLPLQWVLLQPRYPFNLSPDNFSPARFAGAVGGVFSFTGVAPGSYYVIAFFGDPETFDSGSMPEIYAGVLDANNDGVADRLDITNADPISGLVINATQIPLSLFDDRTGNVVSVTPDFGMVNVPTITTVAVEFSNELAVDVSGAPDVQVMIFPPPMGMTMDGLPRESARLGREGRSVEWDVTLEPGTNYVLWVQDATFRGDDEFDPPTRLGTVITTNFSTGTALPTGKLLVNVLLPAGVAPSNAGYVVGILGEPPTGNDPESWDIRWLQFSYDRQIKLHNLPDGDWYAIVVPWEEGKVLPAVYTDEFGVPTTVNVTAGTDPQEVDITLAKGLGVGIVSASPSRNAINVPTQTVISVTFDEPVTAKEDGVEVELMTFPIPLAMDDDSVSTDELTIYKRVTLQPNTSYQILVIDERSDGAENISWWSFSTGTTIPTSVVAGNVYNAFSSSDYEGSPSAKLSRTTETSVTGETASTSPFVVALVENFPSAPSFDDDALFFAKPERVTISIGGVFLLQNVPEGAYYLIAQQIDDGDDSGTVKGFAYLDANKDGVPDEVIISAGVSALGLDMPAKLAVGDVVLQSAKPGMFATNVTTATDTLWFVFKEGALDTTRSFGEIAIFPEPLSGGIDGDDFTLVTRQRADGEKRLYAYAPGIVLAPNTTYTIWFFNLHEMAERRFIAPYTHVFTTGSAIPGNRVAGKVTIPRLAGPDPGYGHFVVVSDEPSPLSIFVGEQGTPMLRLSMVDASGSYSANYLEDGTYYLTSLLIRKVTETGPETFDFGTSTAITLSGGRTITRNLIHSERLSISEPRGGTLEEGEVNFPGSTPQDIEVVFGVPAWSEGELLIDSTSFSIWPPPITGPTFERGANDNTIILKGVTLGSGVFQFSVYAGDKLSSVMITTAAAMPTGQISGRVFLAAGVTELPKHSFVLLGDTPASVGVDPFESEIVQTRQLIDGSFTFENVPDGTYYIIGISYYGDDWERSITSSLAPVAITVAQGQQIDGVVAVIGGTATTAVAPNVKSFDASVVKMVTLSGDLYVPVIRAQIVDANGLETIASVTVTDPSGTEHSLTPSENGYYVEGLSGSLSFSGGTFSIRATDDGGTRSNTVSDSIGPIKIGPPVLVGPANNLVNASLTPKLDWNDRPGAAGYAAHLTTGSPVAGTVGEIGPAIERFFDADSAIFHLLNAPITATEQRVPSGRLRPGTDYWWTAAAVDKLGDVDHIVMATPYRFTTRFDAVVIIDRFAPQFVSKPQIDRIDETSITVSWTTDEDSDTRVAYGFAMGALVDSVSDPSLTKEHRIKIDDLTSATTYYLAAASSDHAGNWAVSVLPYGIKTKATADTLAPEFSIYPVIELVTDEQITMFWNNNEPTTATVTLSSTEGDTSVYDDRLVPDHRVTIKDLKPGTSYTWRIEVIDEDINGPTVYSGSHAIRTKDAKDEKPPRIMVGPIVITRHDGALIKWRSNELSTALVQIRVGAGWGEAFTEGYADAPKFEQAVMIPGLDPQTTYNVMVVLQDLQGNRTVNNPLDFRTLATPDVTPPEILEPPTPVYLSNDRMVLAWKTDEPSDSYVQVLLNDQVVIEAGDGRMSRIHRVAVTGLETATKYDFVIYSSDASGNTVVYPEPVVAKVTKSAGGRGGSEFSTAPTADVTAPIVTTPPTVLAKTASTLTIKWETDEVSNSVVYYGENGATKLTRVAEDQLTSSVSLTENVTTHTVTVTDLTADTPYTYRIASTDPSGNGLTSTTDYDAETLAAEDHAKPIINEAATVVGKTDTRLTIRWVTDEPSNSVVAYLPAGAAKLSEVETPTVTIPDLVNEHFVTLTNLDPLTEYSLTIRSTDLNGNGPTTADLSGTTSAGADVTAPVISAGPDVIVDATQVRVAWTTDEPANAEVEFGETETFGRIVSKSDFGTGHQVVVTGLDASTTYFYRIASTDASGNATDSTSTSLIWTTRATADTTRPAIVTGLSKVVGAYAAKLYWSAVADSDLAGYNIYRSVDGGDWQSIASLVGAVQLTDPAVEPDRSYGYYVVAEDNSSNRNVSFPSDTVLAKPLATFAPGQPTNPLVADITGEKHAPIRPTLSVGNAITGIRTTKGYTFKVCGDSALTQVLASVTDLAEGLGTTSWRVPFQLGHLEEYYWAVQAVDDSGFAGPLTKIGSFIADSAVWPEQVTLSSFAAASFRQAVKVQWSLASGSAPAVFNIWRSAGEGGEFERINSEPIEGLGPDYRFLDMNLVSGQSYQYRLEAVSSSGTSTMFGPVSAMAALPQNVALDQNIPNPFNPVTSMSYQVPVASNVRLSIYNALGQQVRVLVNARLSAGYYRVVWNGTTFNGRNAGSGLYFARLIVTSDNAAANIETRTIRMTMVK
jgi:beta-lactam-binding protein with PASTA domain